MKLDEARSQRPLPSFCFSGRLEKKNKMAALTLIGIFEFSKSAERIQQTLTGSKISTSAYKFVFFGPIGKTRWPPWPLIVLDIFDFSSETAKGNSTKLDRSEILTSYTKFVFFGPIGETRWPH